MDMHDQKPTGSLWNSNVLKYRGYFRVGGVIYSLHEDILIDFQGDPEDCTGSSDYLILYAENNCAPAPIRHTDCHLDYKCYGIRQTSHIPFLEIEVLVFEIIRFYRIELVKQPSDFSSISHSNTELIKLFW